MAQGITHLPFEEWIYFIFDHPTEGPEWYGHPDAPFWSGPPAQTAQYVARLFEDPCAPLAGFSDAELNMGLWYLISPGLGEHMLCLDDPEVPIAERVRCVRSIESLFRELFLPRCSQHLSHTNWQGAAPLNSICYMWWDIMPVYGGPKAEDRDALHGAALKTMIAVLQLDSLACQESALHGLGHWRAYHPEQIERVIDAFIVAHPTAHPDLLTYARSARCGCIL